MVRSSVLETAKDVFKSKLRGILALIVVGAASYLLIVSKDAERALILAVIAMNFYFDYRRGNGDTR